MTYKKRRKQVTCPECGYEWPPRVDEPKRCANPRCGHPMGNSVYPPSVAMQKKAAAAEESEGE
jgi:ribosomal protein L37AE/L43A